MKPKAWLRRTPVYRKWFFTLIDPIGLTGDAESIPLYSDEFVYLLINTDLSEKYIDLPDYKVAELNARTVQS